MRDGYVDIIPALHWVAENTKTVIPPEAWPSDPATRIAAE